MFAYCGNNPINRVDPTGEAWWHWVAATVVVAALVVASIVTCGGAAAAAATATAIVAGTCTTVSTTATIITGAAVGAGVAYAGAAINAASNSNSLDEFAEYGESALVETIVGGGAGAAAGYVNTRTACFVAGTLVLTENGRVEIEDISADDYVWAWDEETGNVALKRVVETYVNETTELIHVFVNGEEIITTPTHPFYCPVKGWTDAAKLRAGDILVLVNGEYVVVEKVQYELLENPVKVYNFHVEDYHTYFVCEKSVLVHNSCFNPKENSRKAAKLGNGSKAYLQDGGRYSGQYVAKDFTGHGHNTQSAYKLFELTNGKYLRLIGDLAADGSFMASKHSSNADKLYEVVRWITLK